MDVRSLSYRYRKNEPVLNDVSFSIEKGMIAALIGRNGAGKSTLFGCLSQQIKGYEGEISFNGVNAKTLKRDDLARAIAYVPQLSEAGALTVYEAVLLGRLPHYHLVPSKEDHRIVEALLEELGLTHLAFRTLKEISGGERQKALLGVALAEESEVLLLDEPTNNLDIKAVADLFDILQKLIKTRQISVIFSTHDLPLAYQFADQVLLLSQDGTLELGDKGLLNSEAISKAFGEDILISSHDGHLHINYRRNNV